ncbi:MAG: hypothetical protein PHQ43_01260 [Dehalococcoidales bacterium]|nr:hypothetical protein [Dehalococcoidales bacterium]
MLELRPTDYIAGVQPRPKILLVNDWIKFSNNFPDTLSHVKGKTACIAVQQEVNYQLSYLLKEGCYTDVDLSNDTGVNLYPDVASNLYEMLIGFKPGNYFVQIYFPADYPIYRLDEPSMYPNIGDTNLKYLGAIRPGDSPDRNPILKLYLVYKLKPIILRMVVDDGIDYEKMTMNFSINRCVMNFGKALPAGVTPKPILYLDEISQMREVSG